MKTQNTLTIEDFLTAQDPVKEKTLRSVIDFILSEFPELEVKIAWKVPQFHRKGKYVAGIAAYKNHLTFAPWSYRAMEEFEPRLENYKVFKGCFQIPVDWEIDKALIGDLVRARLAELDEESRW